ncbi:MAG: DUF4203 domain-containing protein [Eubacteriales bacterium]|nr:DUF4203 domain-containing protein [Eubacteriales bacterium]
MLSQLLLKLENLMLKIQNPTSPEMEMAIKVLVGGLLVVGLLNVFLGFRLMRFWMIMGSLCMGAAAGIVGGWWLELPNIVSLCIGAGLGVGLAVLSFFVYNWGVFVLGMGMGCVISIYIIHPTSSLSFFLCLLLGVGVGVLGMKFSRGILILGTSVIGGLLAGICGAYLGGLSDIPGPLGIPYGVLLGAGIAALGVLIQFATNPSENEEENEEKEKPQTQGKIRRDEFGRKYRE